MKTLIPDEAAIFNAARNMKGPEERRLYLDGVCEGDERLRVRIEALLQVHERQPGFLESPALEMPTSIGPITTTDRIGREGPGTQVGAYKLLQQIGEGGMGIVFMAEQTQPVHREVALKIINPGMDSRQVIARFEAERQALALMDHPNIAKVFDGGTTDSGRPYFVMELVPGIPITQYCDEHRLTPKERLELFIPVCQAIQHAHQKGIIHRDLKPSNVLIARYDGMPVVKVIDFGVAKATGQRLTEKTLFTEFGAMVGTLEYMSPEQAELNNQDIDTRSDIYSLGVLLYELLTGTTPLNRAQLKQAAFTEILRLIREQEPPKPSTRLSESKEWLPSISAQRHMEPAKLTKLVRGELDWIVMKALEKDRNRRYETANGFAMDVQRYLHDEPVLAGPPGAGYRLRKFVKRHRGRVLVATVVLLALVVGIVGTTLGLVEAWRQRDLTEQAREAAVKNAEKAKEEEGKAKSARDDAQRLAKEEKAARQRADKQLLRAEWLLYASQLSLAQQAWESNNGNLAYHYLESCRPDFRGWEHDYLFTLFNRNQQTFRGHKTRILSVAVSPDGKRIVSGDWDKIVKVWDAATGQLILTLPRHKDSVSSVAFSHDGKRIVCGSSDVKIWEAATGQEILTLTGHKIAVSSVAVSADGKRIASGSYDKTVKLWDAATGMDIRTLRGHTDAVTCVAFSSDGKRVISSSFDKTVKVWNADTGQALLTLEGHSAEVSSVAVSPDGKRIVSGSFDKTAKVWDADAGQALLTLKGHSAAVASVDFSPDAKTIVSGSHDKTVKVWQAATGHETLVLKGHTNFVSSVALTPDGKRIVSGSHDRTVKIWGTATSQEIPTLKGHVFPVDSVAMSLDGKRIVSSGWDGTVKVWDSATGQETLSVKGNALALGGSCVAVSRDGKRIVSGGRDATVKVRDSATGKEILTLTGHTMPVTGVALSPDGKRIASASQHEMLKVWDAETGTPLLTLKGGGPLSFTSVAFSPDGKQLISSLDTLVKVWDAASGQEIQTLSGHTSGISGVAVSSDGKQIVSSSLDKTVKVWEAATGREALTLRGHTGPVLCVAILPLEPRRIISGSTDNTVKVWDAATGQETLTLKGHTAVVSSVAVSPDVKRIVSGSADGTLKLWDASMRQNQESGLGNLDLDLPTPPDR